MKWVPVIVWPILAPATRRWGLVWLAVSIGLSVALLPLTIVQFQALFGFGARPIRLDYLVYPVGVRPMGIPAARRAERGGSTTGRSVSAAIT